MIRYRGGAIGSNMSERRELNGAFGAFILFGAVATAGVLAAYAAVEDYARARASQNWPVVEGVILSHSADDQTVRYAWFDGVEGHTGERVRFWTRALYPSGETYEAGKAVKVRYSPDNGALAVLEAGGSPKIFAVALGFAAFLVFIGLAGIIRLTMMLDGLSPAGRAEAASAFGEVGDALVQRRPREFDLEERRSVRDRRGEYEGGRVFQRRALEPLDRV